MLLIFWVEALQIKRNIQTRDLSAIKVSLDNLLKRVKHEDKNKERQSSRGRVYTNSSDMNELFEIAGVRNREIVKVIKWQ